MKITEQDTIKNFDLYDWGFSIALPDNTIEKGVLETAPGFRNFFMLNFIPVGNTDNSYFKACNIIVKTDTSLRELQDSLIEMSSSETSKSLMNEITIHKFQNKKDLNEWLIT